MRTPPVTGSVAILRRKTSFIFVAVAVLAAGSAFASDWTGANANWSSNVNPGWNGTGVPNAIGAIANHGVSTTSVTTQDIGAGVTVGTISLTNNSNNSWSFTLTNAITLNQDGAGAGTATISNTNTNAGATNFLNLGAGTLTLADNLLISNTGASTNATGAIQITSTIGGSGNLTLSNASTALSQTGSIRIQTGVNTFSGSVLVQKGTMTYNNAAVFGNSANAVTLGQSGQGSAAIMSTAGVNVAQNITVAAGSGGTLTLGALGTGAAGFTGTVTLNGNLQIASSVTNAAGLNFSNTISGVGSVTATSGGGASIVQLSGANTYTGNTLISGGTLRLGNNLALQNSALDTSGAGVMNVTGFTTPTFGGLTGSTNLASVITTGYSSVTALALNPQSGSVSYGGVIANGAAGMTLTKTGAGTQILTNTNTYTGATQVNGGTLLVNGSGSLASGSAVSVSGSTSVLGGTGTVNGTVTLSSNGILRGGTGSATTGALTLTNSVDTSAGVIQLVLGATGADHSTLAHTGAQTWTFGATQPFNFIDLGATAGTTYSGIITGIASDPTTEGNWTIQNAGWMGTFSWDSGNGGEINLNLTAVPEPSTWAAGILSVLAVLYQPVRKRVRAARLA